MSSYFPVPEMPPPRRPVSSLPFIIVIVIILVVVAVLFVLLFALPRLTTPTSTPTDGPPTDGPSVDDDELPPGQCNTNADCTAPLDVCNTTINTCVECTAGIHCPVSDDCINNECVLCRPDPPVVNAAGMSGPSTLSASWTAVERAISYTVRYEDTINPPFEFSEWTGITANSLNSSTPTSGGSPCLPCPGDLPVVRVKAFTDCGESGWSDPFPVTNATCC